MKKTYILLTLLLASVFASSAKGVNFSITLSDNEGNLQINTSSTLRLSIIPDNAEGAPCYIETHQVASNDYGVANLILGEGAVVAGSWDEIVWDNDKVFLKVERADNPSADFATLNTIRLGAVPYSYHSNTASNLTLTSPNGTQWAVNVDDNGNMFTTPSQDATVPQYGTVDYIFDMAALPTITIEISTDEWNRFLQNFDANPQNEECVHADFYFNKRGKIHHLSDIGVRLRGNTSRVRPEGYTGQQHSPNGDFHHVHFGFRFQKFHKDDPDWLLSGTDRFSLRWAKEDPTYIHEIYSFDLMRRFGVYTTARSSFCRVYIKFKEEETPVYYGVYEMFEAYDDQYLDDHTANGDFAGTSGFLWKGGWGSGVGADFSNADRNLMGIENVTLNPSETEAFTYDYKSKKKKLEEAKDQLCDFINNLNSLHGDQFHQWAEEHIDIDLLLRVAACEVAVGSWDDCWGNGNNFYAYFDNDGDGKLKFIPYDLDNTLGTSSADDAATKNPVRWGNSPLFNKVLEVTEYYNRYVGYLKQLADPENDYIDPEKSALRINKWHDLIRDYVDNDTHEDTILRDAPASWSSTPHYRVLGSDNNFFRAKVNAINALQYK